jgi:uncharacterized protein (TIGR00251 family)
MKTLRIKVKPNSRVSGLALLDDGSWLARIKAPPVDGKANRELIALVAERFGLPRNRVSIRSGAAGRIKLVTVDD